VTAVTAIAIDGMGLTGVLRLTWVRDNLAHVLDHSHTDETSGTWTGLAAPFTAWPWAPTWTTRRYSDCSATLTVSVSGLIGVIEGERAGFARVLVAGCAARRHRERVGFGRPSP
jgi:hypothetical protein